MEHLFEKLRSPQIAEAVKADALLLIPVGQVEEHGPHLPLYADWLIASELSLAAARRLEDKLPALVMSGVLYGYSTVHLKRWAGTIRLRQETVRAVVLDLARSVIEMGFRKIVFVSGHGHHTGIMRTAVRSIWDEHNVDAAVVFPGAMAAPALEQFGKAGPGGSCHAGELETLLLLHLAPELVDMQSAPSGDRLKLDQRFGSAQVFWSTWNRQESASGAYGEPSFATAETGKAIFEAVTSRMAEFLEEYHSRCASAE